MNQMNLPEFTCLYCGAPSHIDPSDQEMPVDYCHDHGEFDEHDED